jgi:hypothetical protein
MVPAGKQAARASKASQSGLSRPLTDETMCITWL